MPRKRTISEENIIVLIDSYLKDQCFGKASLLKFKDLAAYIEKNGYPGYAVTTLTRDQVAREYIGKLQALEDRNVLPSHIVYTPINAEDFARTHRSVASIKEGISALDRYYSSVAAQANKILKENVSLRETNEAQAHEIEVLNNRIQVQALQIKELTNTNKMIKEEMDAQNKHFSNVYQQVEKALIPPVLQQNPEQVLPNEIIKPIIMTGATPFDAPDICNIDFDCLDQFI